MKEAIVKFEPFTFRQSVYFRDTKTGKIEQERIPQSELSNYLSLVDDIETIHFFGNEKFVRKFKTECLTKYKMEKVNILINE